MSHKNKLYQPALNSFILGAQSLLSLFSCPGQLNRRPCHSVSERLLFTAITMTTMTKMTTITTMTTMTTNTTETTVTAMPMPMP